MTFLAGFAAGALAAAAVFAWRAHALRMKIGRFFSFAAHEINTPITAINMTVLNLAGGVFGEVPKDQRKWLEMTREQLVRLNGMVGELRDFIHLEFQRDLAVRFEEIQPAEVVAYASRAIKLGCEQAGIEVSIQVEEGLGAMRADADRLGRSVSTLAFHARKFHAGGPIAIGARKAPGGGAVFTVSFNGPKLSAGDAARSLEVFFPAEIRRTHAMTATGLGLGVVRELARRQGGELELSIDAAGRQTLSLRVPDAPAKVVR
jgi:signal transduction histidine kinase